MDEDLRKRRGLYWNKAWYSNKGNDHYHNAIEIMYKFSKLYPNEDWDWHKYSSPLDFFIFRKKAIQIANGDELRCIIASAHVYDLEFFEKFKEKHNLHGYKVYLIWETF